MGGILTFNSIIYVVEGKDGGMVRTYGTPQFLLRSSVRHFCNGTGTVRWYAVRIKNSRLSTHCAGFLYAEAKTPEADKLSR